MRKREREMLCRGGGGGAAAGCRRHENQLRESAYRAIEMLDDCFSYLIPSRVCYFFFASHHHRSSMPAADSPSTSAPFAPPPADPPAAPWNIFFLHSLMSK